MYAVGLCFLYNSSSIDDQIHATFISSDAFGNIDHKILGNQTAAKLFEEVLLFQMLSSFLCIEDDQNVFSIFSVILFTFGTENYLCHFVIFHPLI